MKNTRIDIEAGYTTAAAALTAKNRTAEAAAVAAAAGFDGNDQVNIGNLATAAGVSVTFDGNDEVYLAAVLAAVDALATISLLDYMLNDPGTLATSFGRSAAPTNAPQYLQADYTYTGAATGGSAIALPAAANIFDSHAITVGAGTKLYVEALIVAVAATYEEIGIRTVQASGGAMAGTSADVNIRNAGGTPTVGWAGGGSQAMVAAATSYRIGLVFNGDTGGVTVVSTDGVLATVAAQFTPGNGIAAYLSIGDSGISTVAGVSSIRLVPDAADMVLPGTIGGFPAGCTDVNGTAL